LSDGVNADGAGQIGPAYPGVARLHRDRYLMDANVRPAALHPRLAPMLAASVAALAVAGGTVACGGGTPASSALVSVSNRGCGAGCGA